mgnify:FL=1
MYLTRTLEKSIQKVSDFFPVLLVTGPRQVGKTTILQACGSERRNYISLDTLENRSLAQNDPALFLQRFKAPLLIDEIQYAPQLFPYIKAAVDEQKQSGMYWLTGSQQFHLMKNVSESLAGRVGILHLEGFSQAERDGQPERRLFLPTPKVIEDRAAFAPKTDIEAVFHQIWKGSYPRMHEADDDMWQFFYDAYVQTYIERDIRDLGSVGNELDFLKFMKVLAARTGQLLNYSDIARDVGISAPTVKAWVSLLQTSGLIFILQPYHNNINSRVIKTPKVYFMDTGLVCYLTGWNAPQTLENCAMSGELLETYVISEIVKSWWHNGKQPNIYYYRDKDRREIDVILEENGVLYPIEIKKKSNPNAGDIKAFDAVETVLKQKRGHGAVLCMARTHLPITAEVDAVPISYI